MVLFGKAKDEGPSYAEASEGQRPSYAEASEGRGKSISGRNPTARKTSRAKKEPPKTWGKKERILVLGIILFSAITSGVLALSAREWKLPGFPRLAFPKIKFFAGETLVFTNEVNQVVQVEQVEQAERIKIKFNELTKDLSGVYGFYIIDLKSGHAFGINEDEIFEAASLIKLPVILAMYREFEGGNFAKDTEYSLKNEDKITGVGSLYSKPAGTTVTYQDLVRLMANQSDNAAYGIAKNLLGNEKIEEAMKLALMNDTNLEENETSLEDVGSYFSRLWGGDLVSQDNRDEILEYLTDTSFEAWLAAGVPDNVRAAHKFGRETHVVNDAGIVYTDDPYVIVIMSKGVVEREADEVFPKISRMVYEEMNLESRI